MAMCAIIEEVEISCFDGWLDYLKDVFVGIPKKTSRVFLVGGKTVYI